VYHFVFFLFALSDCKGTTFFLIPAFLGRIIVILTVRFIDVYPRFAAKRIPFCGKTRSILRQNAFHFAAKRIPFCGKTHSILRQNAFHFAAKRISLLPESSGFRLTKRVVG